MATHALLDAALADARAWADGRAGDAWADSPHRWFRDLTSRRKGAAGERIVEGLFVRAGFAVTAGHGGADRTVNGHGVEIKVSTEWDRRGTTGGEFSFSQIRDQDWEAAVLVGIRPHDVALWVVPKAILMAAAAPQHTGKTGTETMCESPWVWWRLGLLDSDQLVAG